MDALDTPPWTPRERRVTWLFAVAAAFLVIEAVMLWPTPGSRASTPLLALSCAGVATGLIALYFDRHAAAVWQWLPLLASLVIAGALPFLGQAHSKQLVLGYLAPLALAFVAALFFFRARYRSR